VATGTATDSIGSANGTVNGVSSVSGTYQGGSAGDGDGTDDYIDVGTLGSFGSNLDTDFAISFTVDDLTTSNRVAALGGVNIINGEGGPLVELNEPSAGGVSLILQDETGDFYITDTSSGGFVDDGAKHRVLLNKTQNSGGGGNDIYIDNTQVSTTVDLDQGFSSVSDFTAPLYLFARSTNGTDEFHTPGVLDDVIFYGSSLSSSEISDDYNLQPWS